MNRVGTIHRACPICGKDNAQNKPSPYSDAQWVVKKCAACKFTYLEVAPVYELLIKDLAWEQTSLLEAERRRVVEPVRQAVSTWIDRFRWRYLRRDKLSALIRSFVPAGNVLDVGCAAGGCLASLDDIYVPYGIEISQALVLKAQEVVSPRGGRVFHDNALAGLRQFPSSFFSGILMSAFLEHEINPKEVLQESCRCLSETGCCIIKVPNFGSLNRMVRGRKWCGFYLPDHVNYFTPKSLLHLCRAAGFDVARFNVLDHLPTSDNMWMVIRKPLGALQS